ncbi:MAG: PepSY domain-containing protein [Candidatus Zixiibacteriota bacterium]
MPDWSLTCGDCGQEQLKMRVFTISLFFAACIGFTPVTGGEHINDDQCLIDTPDKAVSRAIAYTGFDKSKALPLDHIIEKTKLTMVTNDRTPYLHEQINNVPVWEVTFDDINVCDGNSDESKCLRTFDVLIDQATGKLLKIHSIQVGYDTGKSPLPTVEYAEKQMQASEVYLGFPDELPEYVFIEALSNTAYKAKNAGEIIAVYVKETYMDSAPNRIWAIDLRGIDPIPIASHYSSMYVPECQRNHRRTVIDAKTRHQMFIDTFPQSRCRF